MQRLLKRGLQGDTVMLGLYFLDDCDIFRYHLDVKQSKETHNTTVNLLIVYHILFCQKVKG